MEKWTKQYSNDVGPDDEWFEEWWEVTDGKRIFRCEDSKDADFLISLLAQQQRKPLSESLINDLFSNFAKDERTKVFTEQNWFQVGLITGEVAHDIKE